MVVSDASIHNIMGGMESTGGVRLHNHRRKLKQRFDIIKKLGQGTYGKVQLGINKETGQEVAIKTIKKAKIETEADLIRIRREIQIMSSVQHPNIIHIYEVFENREKMVLVMEYAAGGELYDYLSERKVLSETEARRIFRQISTAVYYCHKHKICHRDLKLENILLDEHGSAKIADFGLSNVFDEQRLLSTFCGSPLYASPEIVKGTPYHGPEVDCWSLGVLLYTLVYGAMPFDGSNFKRLVRQISQGDYFEPKKPSPASPLIREMLTVTPSRRADIEKICSHWWVNEGYGDSCLEIAEELANQTPVRLDLLLSLAPPGPSVGSDKLLVGTEQEGGSTVVGNDVTASVPARCHSVGSLMELDHRHSDVGPEDITGKDTAKRKLEGGISTEEANRGAAKRKERCRRSTRERSSDRHRGRSGSRSKQKSDSLSTEDTMEVDSGVVDVDQSLQASAETIVGSVKTATSSVETIAGSSTHIDEGLETTNNATPKDRASTDLDKDLEEKNCEPEGNECPGVPTNGIQIPNAEQENTKIKVKRKKRVSSDSKVATNDSGSKIVDSVNMSDNSETLAVNDYVNIDNVVSEATAQKSQQNENSNVEVGDTTKAVGDANANIMSSTVSSPVDIPKRIGTKARRSKGDLSLGKLGSGSEKSSGANTPEDTASPPSKPMERRRSKIFETAEKFNNLISEPEPKSPTSEKPKKVFIPGVKVSDAKRAFERKSSSAASVPSLSRTSSLSKKADEIKIKGSEIDNLDSAVDEQKNHIESKDQVTAVKNTNDEEGAVFLQNETSSLINETSKKLSDLELNDQPMASGIDSSGVLHKDDSLKLIPPLKTSEKSSKQEEARIKKLKDAVEIIGNAINEGHRKDVIADQMKKGAAAKPPVPVPQELKTKTKTICISSPLSPKSPPLSPIDLQTEVPETRSEKTPETWDNASGNSADPAGRKKSSKVEITLKSATLPRRKTSKAEIRLNSPNVPPVGFHTEVSHIIEPADTNSQRFEKAFPVSAAAQHHHPRSVSLEPEGKNSKPREHIIPIHVEEGSAVRPSGAAAQRVYTSQRSGSLSRQSTQDSDTDSTVSVGPEPIRKSPREYIIPIAVEGGGYVTPRAGSLEPSVSDENNTKPRQRKTSRLGRHRRLSGLLSDASEDEGFNSPFATLQRHSSLSYDREPETREDDKSSFHMHRLRSSRPSRGTLEHNDSLSSAEDDDDDDDGFEILTAESLFSTLLSRVRSLTQRLNVEDGSRPGFPSSTLMSQLKNVGRTPPSRLWTNMGEPLSRRLSETSRFSRSFSRDQDIPWRRSTSRDLSETGSMYSESSGTTPRGSAQSESEPSGLGAAPQYTPSLSRRLLPEAGRRLARTTSVREGAAPTLPPAPRRSGSGSSCGALPPLPRRRPALGLGEAPPPRRPSASAAAPAYHRERLSSASVDETLERIRAERSAAGLPDFRPSYAPATSRFRRSASFSQDADYGRPASAAEHAARLAREASSATSPDRSVLGKFLRQGSDDRKLHSGDPNARGSAATDVAEAATKKTRKISRFLRPDFFDTPREESVYAKEKEAQKSAEAEAKKAKRLARRAALLEKKQAEGSKEKSDSHASPTSPTLPSSTVNTQAIDTLTQTPIEEATSEYGNTASKKPETNKNRFLQSLEKKLEKLRSGGGDSAIPSRVEQAINSLRKQSAPADVPSESALLKRAVSVDDVRLPPSARPVSSVLGLLRRMEGSNNRRTQSVYAGATSDTVLLTDTTGVKVEKRQNPALSKTGDAKNSGVSSHSKPKSGDKQYAQQEKVTETTEDDNRNVGMKQGDKKALIPELRPSRKEDSEGAKKSLEKGKDLSSDKPTVKANEIPKPSPTRPGSCASESVKSVEKVQGNKSLQQNTVAYVPSIQNQIPSANNHLRKDNVEANSQQNQKLNLKTATVPSELDRNITTLKSVTEKKNLGEKKTLDLKKHDDINIQSYKPNALNDLTALGLQETPALRENLALPKSIVNSISSTAGGNAVGGKSLHAGKLDEYNQQPTNVSKLDARKLSLNLPKFECQVPNNSNHLSPVGKEDSLYATSPIDESESIDSWSVCSDLEGRDFSLSSFPKTPSPVMEDETVEERIRRKSFYTRFNDIRRKNHRKSSSGHLLGLKDSVSRISNLSDPALLGVFSRKAVRSHSLYSPNEIEAFVHSNAAGTGLDSTEEIKSSAKLDKTSPKSAGALQNGYGKKGYKRAEDPLSSRTLPNAAEEVSGVKETSTQKVEMNGPATDCVEGEAGKSRAMTAPKSKLPTPARLKKNESSNAELKQSN